MRPTANRPTAVAAIFVTLAPLLWRGLEQGLPVAAAIALTLVVCAVPDRGPGAALLRSLLAGAVFAVLTVPGFAVMAAGLVAAVQLLLSSRSGRWRLVLLTCLALGILLVVVTPWVAVPALIVWGAVGGTIVFDRQPWEGSAIADRVEPANRILIGTAPGVLLLAGRHPVASAAVFFAGIVFAIAASFPSVAPRVRSLEHRTVTFVAALLGTILLWPIHVLALAPIGWLHRATGRPLLDLRFGPDDGSPSYWLQGPSIAFEPERMYSKRQTATGGVRAPSRARTVLAVLLVEALLMGAFLVWRREAAPEPQFAGAAAPGATESAALQGLDWVPEVQAEVGSAASGLVYTPYVGWSLRDFAGEHVVVRGRERRSYQPTVGAESEPLEVWFFGGSTMFGFDLQRDEHTIPSEVARLAERDGVAVRVRNFGAPGYVSYQEAVMLSLLVSAGRRPDVAVFYDGTNDLSLQLLDQLGGLGGGDEPGEHYAALMRSGFAETGPVPGMTPAPPSRLTGEEMSEPSARSIARATLDVYAQARELVAALSERGEFDVVHYWQPDAFSTSTLHPAELARLAELGIRGDSLDGMQRISEEVRRGLPAGVVDLSGALEGMPSPVFSDAVHINEVGAQAVAAAMYRSLGPVLRSTAAPG